jgi:hypothetical protein
MIIKTYFDESKKKYNNSLHNKNFIGPSLATEKEFLYICA